MPASLVIDQNNPMHVLEASVIKTSVLCVEETVLWLWMLPHVRWELAGGSETLPLLLVSGCWRQWEFLLVKPQWSSG